MGAQCTRSLDDVEQNAAINMVESPVFLHLYDLGTSCAGQALNQLLRPLGSPAFHCGVEVFRHEWSYCFLTKDGECYEGSGVFSSKPRECDGHTYSQSIRVGSTLFSQAMFSVLIKQIEEDWPSCQYDILSRNCCHFSNEMCMRLGVGSLPAWVMRLSDMGSAISERQCSSAICCDRQRKDSSKASNIGWCGPAPSTKNHAHAQRYSDPWKDDIVQAMAVKSSHPHTGIEETTWYDGESYVSPRPPPSCASTAASWPKGVSGRSSRRAEDDELHSSQVFQGGFVL